MGARPLTAMNIVCFPTETMDISVLQAVLQGGASKIVEAKVVLIGGHSVDDTELKYGLSVTGTVHPKKLLTNSGAKAGDKIILTKALGTGIVSTALKQGLADSKAVAEITKSMLTLNDKAAGLMQEVGVHACTDITGFGLIGHIAPVAQNSGVGIIMIQLPCPFFPKRKNSPGKASVQADYKRNRNFYSKSTAGISNIPKYMQDILFDPQTSGGLLISVAPGKAERLLKMMQAAGISNAAIIGEVVKEPTGIITIT